MLYSYKGQFPASLPWRIRLPDGSTRTNPETFTADDIASAGFIAVDKPEYDTTTQNIRWDSYNVEYIVTDKTPEELEGERQSKINQQWKEVRATRDKLLAALDWRFVRYESQARLGIPTIDDIVALDTYAQALRDITLQADPFNIVWPVKPSADALNVSPQPVATDTIDRLAP